MTESEDGLPNQAPEPGGESISSGVKRGSGLQIGVPTSLAGLERSTGIQLEAEIKVKKFLLQRQLALPLFVFFVLMNVATFGFVLLIWHSEAAWIEAGREFTPLITTEVAMTLIGATTVQLGVISLTMAKWLFQADEQ